MEIQHTKTYGMQQKAVPRGKFIVINAYIEETRKISNNLTLYRKEFKRRIN